MIHVVWRQIKIMKVLVFDDKKALGRKAAGQAASLIRKAIEAMHATGVTRCLPSGIQPIID